MTHADGHTAPHLEQITTIFIRHLPIKRPWRRNHLQKSLGGISC
nr:MAG TPA_asm: hypothetical protein [Bacteriophage sp.]DAU78810.1 MAG TPA: hypothetical protein [Caudoviricetes sp.]